jgi:hypothetical protein
LNGPLGIPNGPFFIKIQEWGRTNLYPLFAFTVPIVMAGIPQLEHVNILQLEGA